MASKLPPQFPPDHQIRYRPQVVKDRVGGYSAEDVNALLHEAEIAYEAYIRPLEAQLLEKVELMERAPRELAELANILHAREQEAQAWMATLEQDRDAALAELDQVRTEISAAQLQLNEMAEAVETATQETESYKAKNGEMSLALEGLRHSLSWRMTRPLRWLAARFRPNKANLPTAD